MKNLKETMLAYKVNMINTDALKQLKDLEKEGYITCINVGTYEEENQHKVYVVHYNGEVYKARGTHGIYKNKSQAKSCITRNIVTKAMENARKRNEKWFHMDFLEQKNLIEKEKLLFEIKEYTEAMEIKDL